MTKLIHTDVDPDDRLEYVCDLITFGECINMIPLEVSKKDPYLAKLGCLVKGKNYCCWAKKVEEDDKG